MEASSFLPPQITVRLYLLKREKNPVEKESIKREVIRHLKVWYDTLYPSY